MRALQIAWAVVALLLPLFLLGLLWAVVVSRPPCPRPLAIVPGFNVAWDETVLPLLAGAVQQQPAQRDPVPADIPPIEPALPPKPLGSVPKLLDPPSAPERSAVRIAAHDICQGRGRYYTHGGRSWRCKRN